MSQRQQWQGVVLQGERDKAEIKSDEKVQEWEGLHWHEGLICCKGGEREGRYTVRLKRCWIQGDK